MKDGLLIACIAAAGAAASVTDDRLCNGSAHQTGKSLWLANFCRTPAAHQESCLRRTVRWPSTDPVRALHPRLQPIYQPQHLHSKAEQRHAAKHPGRPTESNNLTKHRHWLDQASLGGSTADAARRNSKTAQLEQATPRRRAPSKWGLRQSGSG